MPAREQLVSLVHTGSVFFQYSDLGDTPVPSHGVSFLALFNGRNPGTNAPV